MFSARVANALRMSIMSIRVDVRAPGITSYLGKVDASTCDCRLLAWALE